MAESNRTSIHPTAQVDPGARLGDGVTVGPFAIIENDVEIGPGCIIAHHAIIRRYTTLGAENRVHSFAVLGGDPQDYKFDPAQVSYLRIGEKNVFREHVTISRATGDGAATVVGSHNTFQTASHAGHNAIVHDHVTLGNHVAVAGHAVLESWAELRASVNIHQFCWVGEGVKCQDRIGLSMHAPPYTSLIGVNYVVGLNREGLVGREDLTEEDRRQIHEAFRLTYQSGLTPEKALDAMDACEDWGAPADRFRQFIRRVLEAEKPFHRGLCPYAQRYQG